MRGLLRFLMFTLVLLVLALPYAIMYSVTTIGESKG